MTSTVRKTISITAFLLLLALGTYSCTKTVDTPSTPGGQEVTIQNMAYSPSTLTVTVGTTVTWTNKDINAHTVTSNSGAFSSGTISPNETFSFKFVTAGTYPYHCTIHTGMNATVVVN